MLTDQLHDALDAIPDTGEIVIRPYTRILSDLDVMDQAWRAARDEADAALEHWRALRTRDAYAVFRAAEDRADAAQDALATR